MRRAHRRRDDEGLDNPHSTAAARGLAESRQLPSHRRLIELQRTAGNAAVSSMVESFRGDAVTVQRWSVREMLAGAKEKLFGDESTEKKVEKAEEAVERAQTALSAAQAVIKNPEVKERLSKGGEYLEQVAKPMGTYLKISKIVRFAEAVKEFQKSDPSDDSEEFARAAGKLFATAGEVGGLLPEGPWSPYFQFLTNFGDFFLNMRKALDPSIRWKRQFEEIDAAERS